MVEVGVGVGVRVAGETTSVFDGQDGGCLGLGLV